MSLTEDELTAIRDDLQEASSVIDGGDALYNPAALKAMRCAEKLLAELDRVNGELAVLLNSESLDSVSLAAVRAQLTQTAAELEKAKAKIVWLALKCDSFTMCEEDSCGLSLAIFHCHGEDGNGHDGDGSGGECCTAPDIYIVQDNGIAVHRDHVPSALAATLLGTGAALNTMIAERDEANRQKEISDSVCAEAKSLLTRRTSTLNARAEHAEAERDSLRAELAAVIRCDASFDTPMLDASHAHRCKRADGNHEWHDCAECAASWKLADLPTPSNSQDWEQGVEVTPAEYARQVELNRLEVAVLDKAKAWRKAFTDNGPLDPDCYSVDEIALHETVDALDVLESTPDAVPELDPAIEEQGARRLDAQLADINQRVAADKDVIEAAYALVEKASRVALPPSAMRGCWSKLMALVCVVNARKALDGAGPWALESTPDGAADLGAAGEGLTETIHHGPLFADLDWASNAETGTYQLRGNGGTVIADFPEEQFDAFAQMTNEMWDGVSHPEHFEPTPEEDAAAAAALEAMERRERGRKDGYYADEQIDESTVNGPMYRVGRHQPQNVYCGDAYIGVMFSPVSAAIVVGALNGQRSTADGPAEHCDRCRQPELTAIEKVREVTTIQGYDGTWNYSPYMRGMFNGLELALSILEGGRDPVYRDDPGKYLCDLPDVVGEPTAMSTADGPEQAAESKIAASDVSRAVVTMLNEPFEEANRRAWANITRPVGADPLWMAPADSQLQPDGTYETPEPYRGPAMCGGCGILPTGHEGECYL